MIRSLFLLFIFIVQCSDPAVGLQYLPANAVIVAFGDSLTAGVGSDPDKPYPGQLEDLIHRKVINAGVSGETTSQGLKRLVSVLDQHHPQLLLLCEGGNDFLRNLGSQQAKENLNEMISIAKKRGIDVILISVPQSQWNLKPHALFEELAKTWGLPIDGTTLQDIGANQAMLSDPIHPNGVGYKKMAEAVAALLKQYKAID